MNAPGKVSILTGVTNDAASVPKEKRPIQVSL